MQSSKGVYALLLGSGLSRAANIPTGWEITVELVRKVAALQQADCEPDPAAWFRKTTGREPDYSELLDAVAKTPADRQQLLRTYWEPTDQEREEGTKLPTRAHRAIADLIKSGYVRVVLTTNFDRLLETALHDVGVQPTVLASPDHIEGALPLIHTPCTIIKIHGDYLDTRIRNTPAELAAYPQAFEHLLDRIFDEFGLVVAGWSADWDDALRAAATRAPYRRFSMYWAVRGEPGAKAADLIARRGATLVKIADADTFFGALSEQVKALEEFSRPHPLSTEAAVATVKRYLSEPRYRIALDEFVAREVEEVAIVCSSPSFDVHAADLGGDAVLRRLQGYEAASETLMRIAFVAGQWSESEQLAPWTRAFAKLAAVRANGGYGLWLDLQRYPATLLLYCFGLGTVVAKRWSALNEVFSVPAIREGRDDQRVVELVPAWALFDRGDAMKVLPGRDNEYTPLQNHLEELLFPMFKSHFASKATFELSFDRLEVLASLAFAVPAIEKGTRYWTLPGSYGWRRTNRERLFNEIRESLANLEDHSPYVLSGLAGRSSDAALRNLKELEEFVPQLRWR